MKDFNIKITKHTYQLGSEELGRLRNNPLFTEARSFIQQLIRKNNKKVE